MSVGQENFAALQLPCAATVAQLILGNLVKSKLIKSIEIQKTNSCLQT